MALLLCSLFSGTPKVESSPVTQEIQQLKDTVQKLQIQVDALRTQVSKAAEEKTLRLHLRRNITQRPPEKRIDDRRSLRTQKAKRIILPWAQFIAYPK